MFWLNWVESNRWMRFMVRLLAVTALVAIVYNIAKGILLYLF